MDRNSIVRCFGCGSRVRAFATVLEPTGEHGDTERWCLACVADLNEYSSSLTPNVQNSLEQGINNITLDEGDTDATYPD